MKYIKKYNEKDFSDFEKSINTFFKDKNIIIDNYRNITIFIKDWGEEMGVTFCLETKISDDDHYPLIAENTNQLTDIIHKVDKLTKLLPTILNTEIKISYEDSEIWFEYTVNVGEFMEKHKEYFDSVKMGLL